jgi:alpha-glucosidase
VYSDTDTFQQFGRLTQIFASLSNYSKAAVRQNTMEGKPVMRPLFLDFEADQVSILSMFNGQLLQ